MSLREREILIVTYIWTDACGHYKHKKRVFENVENSALFQVPEESYDASSCGQAELKNSEGILKPLADFKDPFSENGLLVFCATYVRTLDENLNDKLVPAKGCYVNDLRDQLPKNTQKKAWFGFEQEFVLTRKNETHQPAQNGTHYCGLGKSLQNVCTQISDQHMHACLTAELKFWGTNAEVANNQWEYQIGICKSPMEAAIHLHVSRYLLLVVAAQHNMDVSFYNKPFGEQFAGSGCHTNYSDAATRDPKTGQSAIANILKRMKETLAESKKVYGVGNHLRLTGKHETAHEDKFTHGIGSRDTSVRVPFKTNKEGCGYIEDRRPGANCDPFRVVAYLLSL